MMVGKFSCVVPTCHEGGFGPWFELDWAGHPNHSMAARRVLLVKEFNANFDGGNPNSVYVKWKIVDISGATINKVYRLDDVEDEYLEFSKSLDEDQLSEIVKEIYVRGTEWTKSAHGSISLSRRSLKPGPMIWNHFFKSRRMPSTHDHTVNKDRAILLFAIVEGRKINVGDVISEQIGVCAGRQSGGLWFPSLITSLCLAQCVEVSSEEKKLKPSGPITMTVITRILHDKPAVAGEENPIPVPEARPPEHSNHIPSGAGSSFLQIEHRISQMERFEANSKRFHSFPQFPQHLCESSTEDSEPERDASPEAVATSHSEEESHEVPTTAPTTTEIKGNATMTKPTRKKSILRSAANWKWKD
ncbi:hypothetical protein TIFTF001_035868 [Ficus carica]|uniref:Putative plant transposon protein domain-containing protein n=1 Tax=Ficus carica TaxID=3494 RepID=A0AA88JC66_FICCA|nr:hypothetical protein TIFTF001_035868 [Ficus carica]